MEKSILDFFYQLQFVGDGTFQIHGVLFFSNDSVVLPGFD